MVSPRYDQATLDAAAKVVQQMSVDPKYWGNERGLLRLALKRILALQEKSDQ